MASMIAVPTKEPTKIVAGDSLTWSKSLSDYPAGEYALFYILHLNTGSAPITIAATASGTDHLISVPAATSASWTAGQYTWYSYVTKGTDRYSLDQGDLTVRPNPTALTASSDLRSHARKFLDAIEATLEGSASSEQAELTIDGTAIKNKTVAELIAARMNYLREVKAEEQAEAIRKGLDSGSRVLTRFV